MTSDVAAARRLLREKSDLRKAELEAADRHFERLREGRPETLETTSLHLDILSDLKRIHSHICSFAYPVLDAHGVSDAAATDAAVAGALAYDPKAL
jgi:phosphate:Na+ symporter